MRVKSPNVINPICVGCGRALAAALMTGLCAVCASGALPYVQHHSGPVPLLRYPRRHSARPGRRTSQRNLVLFTLTAFRIAGPHPHLRYAVSFGRVQPILGRMISLRWDDMQILFM